jgi:5-methylcytosine-specific restriction endonuclease McrA
MKSELLILAITGFLIINTYHDGNYVKLLQSWQKYFKMAGFAFAGMSIYLFLKKNPNESQSIVSQAVNIVKYIPSAKSSLDVLSPFMDFTNQTPFIQNSHNQDESSYNNLQSSFLQPQQQQQQQQINRLMESGKKGTKRCVSETKKKFVASQQGWLCGHCKKQLPAWFEVDHKIRLETGGSNHVDNLVALCRDCHGRKTAMENL